MLLVQQNEDKSERKNAPQHKELDSASKSLCRLTAPSKPGLSGSMGIRFYDNRLSERWSDFATESKKLLVDAPAIRSQFARKKEASAKVEKF